MADEKDLTDRCCPNGYRGPRKPQNAAMLNSLWMQGFLARLSEIADTFKHEDTCAEDDNCDCWKRDLNDAIQAAETPGACPRCWSPTRWPDSDCWVCLGTGEVQVFPPDRT